MEYLQERMKFAAGRDSEKETSLAQTLAAKRPSLGSKEDAVKNAVAFGAEKPNHNLDEEDNSMQSVDLTAAVNADVGDDQCTVTVTGPKSDTSLANKGNDKNSKKLNVITQAKPRICKSCCVTIRDQSYLSIGLDSHFHHNCLKCCVCGQKFEEDGRCHFNNGNAYCEKDYIKVVGVNCNKCCQLMKGDETVVPMNGKYLHLKCFTCKVCGNRPQPREEMAVNLHQDILCEMHMQECRSELDYAIKDQSGVGTDGNEKNSSDKKRPLGKKSRQRTVLTEDQLATLKYYYTHIDRKPSAALKEQICKKTQLTMRVVRVWFQNKRCKEKKDKLRADGILAAGASTGMQAPYLQNSFFYQQCPYVPFMETVTNSAASPYTGYGYPSSSIQHPSLAYGPTFAPPHSPHNPLQSGISLPMGTPPTTSPTYYALSSGTPTTYAGNSPLEVNLPGSIHPTCENGGLTLVDMHGHYRPTADTAQLSFS